MSKSTSYLFVGFLLGVFASVSFYAVSLKDTENGVTLVGKESREVKYLKLGHSLPISHPVHQALEYMNSRVEHYSNGELAIKIYPSGVLGSEVQSLEQLQQGVLAMTKTSAAALESFVDEMKVFGLPYLFHDESHYWQVLDSELGQRLLASLEPKNLRGLTYFDAGSRSFYTREKVIHSPKDLEGLKIRVMNSRMAMDVVTALGAKPTPISWGELYTALAQGTVDGAENNPPSFVSNRHFEVAGNLSLDEHTRIPDVLVISQIIWQQLNDREQGWLQQAANDASLYQRELWQTETKQALDEARSRGTKIIHLDKTPFKEKVEGIYDSLASTPLGELADAVKAYQVVEK